MYIYIANARRKSIVVEKHKVVKETEKQYKLDTSRSVNKSAIGKCNSYGDAFGLSKEEAVESLKKELLAEIEKYEIWIKCIKKTLDLPIVEV